MKVETSSEWRMWGAKRAWEVRVMRNAIWLWLLRILQKRCVHPDYAVIADIEEGARSNEQTQWCAICGAYRLTFLRPTGVGMADWFPNEWEYPRPDWYMPNERKELRRAYAAMADKA